MRADDNQQEGMFSYVSPEKRVPADHPLRPIRKMVDELLEEMSPQFAKLYSDAGRPSIAPERLLRSLLLQIFCSVRSERMLIEQLPVPPQNTSRFCPCCEHVSKDNRKSQSEFVCVECGFSENADLVGAINTKRLGIASFVCSLSSGDVSPSWQKPTESIHAQARN